MPHSLAEIYLHIVFSTKDRIPFLQDRNLRAEMHQMPGDSYRGSGDVAAETSVDTG